MLVASLARPISHFDGMGGHPMATKPYNGLRRRPLMDDEDAASTPAAARSPCTRTNGARQRCASF